MNNTIETIAQPTFTTIQRPRQRYLNTEEAIQYIKDVYGVTVAKATLYKKRSVEKAAFIGRRSPFNRLCFDPLEIDAYMTGKPVEADQNKGGEA